jgi:hypothetical protein
MSSDQHRGPASERVYRQDFRRRNYGIWLADDRAPSGLEDDAGGHTISDRLSMPLRSQEAVRLRTEMCAAAGQAVSSLLDRILRCPVSSQYAERI